MNKDQGLLAIGRLVFELNITSRTDFQQLFRIYACRGISKMHVRALSAQA